MEEEEVQKIIDENKGADGEDKLSYAVMKDKLYEILTKVKKVKFSTLVKQHYSLHLDRVSSFLHMLTDDFSFG